MRSQPALLVSVVVVLVAALVGGALVYDHGRAGTIAEGISVGGVDLGGMNAQDARYELDREILGPLSKPVVVRRGAAHWRLGPKEAHLRADLKAMVDEALARSRDASLPQRVWRGIRGQGVRAELEPTVAYSDRAVTRFVARVRAAVRSAPRDASVKLSGAGVAKVASHPGRELRAAALDARIRSAITSPTASRTLGARTRPVAAQVTTDELAKRYATVLIVQRSAFRLQVYRHLKLATTYPIAVGQVGLETPAGQYSIANKAVNPAWHVPNSAWAGDLAGTVVAGDDPSNPIKARWLGIYGGVGIHGTGDDASIGSNASHGCIRMHVADVEALYPQVPVGTPVYIA